MYMGVKMPNSPPLTNPTTAFSSIIWVLAVPSGANRRYSNIFSENFVRRRPNQLNWKRCVNGFHDGMSGSILYDGAKVFDMFQVRRIIKFLMANTTALI